MTPVRSRHRFPGAKGVLRVVPSPAPDTRAEAPALSDAAIVAACGAGDPAALALLYDRHADGLYRFLARLAHVDDAAVEDLVHDTFLAAFRASAGWRGEASVKVWLFGISSNLAKAAGRASVRYRNRLARLAVEELGGFAASAEEDVLRREALTRVAAAMDELPHDTRAAFLLCDVEGLPGVECARVLGVPPGTFYRRLHGARAALRNALDEEPSRR